MVTQGILNNNAIDVMWHLMNCWHNSCPPAWPCQFSVKLNSH